MPFIEVPETFAIDVEGGRRRKRSKKGSCKYRGTQVHIAKNGAHYVYTASGRTRFVKKSHCKKSRRR